MTSPGPLNYVSEHLVAGQWWEVNHVEWWFVLESPSVQIIKPLKNVNLSLQTTIIDVGAVGSLARSKTIARRDEQKPKISTGVCYSIPQIKKQWVFYCEKRNDVNRISQRYQTFISMISLVTEHWISAKLCVQWSSLSRWKLFCFMLQPYC